MSEKEEVEDTGNVVFLSEKTDSAKSWSVVDMLEDTQDRVKSKEFEANKALVITLNDNDGVYDATVHQSGMNMNECLALLDIGKVICRNEMGY